MHCLAFHGFVSWGIHEHGILERRGVGWWRYSLIFLLSEILKLALARLCKTVGSVSPNEGIRVLNKYLYEPDILWYIAQSKLELNRGRRSHWFSLYVRAVDGVTAMAFASSQST